VIFGNVEKIYEFHSQHFLRELEQCEQSPMLVGQCFLRHVSITIYLTFLINPRHKSEMSRENKLLAGEEILSLRLVQ